MIGFYEFDDVFDFASIQLLQEKADALYGPVGCANLVLNGDFSDGVNEWIPNNATLSAENEELIIHQTGSYGRADQIITGLNDYELFTYTGDYLGGSIGGKTSIKTADNNTVIVTENIDRARSYEINFRLPAGETSAMVRVQGQEGGDGDNTSWDNISVKCVNMDTCPNLVINGTFSVNPDHWTIGNSAALDATNGKLHITCTDGGWASAEQPLTGMEDSKTYVASCYFEYVDVDGYFVIKTADNTENIVEITPITESGYYYMNFQLAPGETGCIVKVLAEQGATGNVTIWDNISVKCKQDTPNLFPNPGFDDGTVGEWYSQNDTSTLNIVEISTSCSELIENGTFDTTVDGVTPRVGTPTIEWIDDGGNGRCQITAPTEDDEWAQYEATVEAGVTYLAHGDYFGDLVDFNILRLEGDTTGLIHDFYKEGIMVPDVEFTAQEENLRFVMRNKSGNPPCIVDNLSLRCKEIELYGPELLVNGDFSDGLNGWDFANTSVVDGQCVIDGTLGTAYINQIDLLEEGKRYRMEVQSVSGSSSYNGDGYKLGSGDIPYTIMLDGSGEVLTFDTDEWYLADAGDENWCQVTDPSSTIIIDNISLREIL